jgi:nitroreductase
MFPNGGPELPVHELIAQRWSPRAFADRSVSPELLRRLFEAARWAASSYNEQPWRWLVATREDKEGFARLHSTLIPFNQGWVAKAPVLAISVAHTSFERNGKPNRHAAHDVGQAAAQMALEAVANGLFIHQMAGFDSERVREVCAVPADHEPVAAIAIGYPGDPETLDAPLRERELATRERRGLDLVVFGTTFGQTAGFAR